MVLMDRGMASVNSVVLRTILTGHCCTVRPAMSYSSQIETETMVKNLSNKNKQNKLRKSKRKLRRKRNTKE